MTKKKETPLPISDITLRDYFAAKAMGDVLVSKHIVTMKYSELASGAYKIADAMLEERSK